jgi:hypothetical protein
MKSLTIRIGCGALALALVIPGAASSAAVTFLGAHGAGSWGGAVVGWTSGGVDDSLVQTIPLSPDSLYAGRTFSAEAVSLTATLGLALAASGTADSTAPVASGALYLYEYGPGTAPARRVQSVLDLALRYQADQPTIYWAIIETLPGINPPPGPAGEATLSHPPANTTVTDAQLGYCRVAMAGSDVNTGTLDIGALLRAIRADGEASSWTYSLGFDVYLSDSPLTHFVTDVPAPAPARLAFDAPRPNPARGGATLDFALPAVAGVRLEIFDCAGRRVRTLAEGVLPAGAHRARWDGRDDRGARSDAGVYFARLTTGRETRTHRFVLLP